VVIQGLEYRDLMSKKISPTLSLSFISPLNNPTIYTQFKNVVVIIIILLLLLLSIYLVV